MDTTVEFRKIVTSGAVGVVRVQSLPPSSAIPISGIHLLEPQVLSIPGHPESGYQGNLLYLLLL